jgi:hypothetical protein
MLWRTRTQETSLTVLGANRPKVKYDVLVNEVSSAQTRSWTDYRFGASLLF